MLRRVWDIDTSKICRESTVSHWVYFEQVKSFRVCFIELEEPTCGARLEDGFREELAAVTDSKLNHVVKTTVSHSFVTYRMIVRSKFTV